MTQPRPHLGPAAPVRAQHPRSGPGPTPRLGPSPTPPQAQPGPAASAHPGLAPLPPRPEAPRPGPRTRRAACWEMECGLRGAAAGRAASGTTTPSVPRAELQFPSGLAPDAAGTSAGPRRSAEGAWPRPGPRAAWGHPCWGGQWDPLATAGRGTPPPRWGWAGAAGLSQQGSCLTQSHPRCPPATPRSAGRQHRPPAMGWGYLVRPLSPPPDPAGDARAEAQP